MVARKRTQTTARSDDTAAKCAVELPHVLAAIESLYMDQIKPVSRILRKRISERSPTSSVGRSEAHWEINADDLKALCFACPSLVIENVDGGDWAALLVGRPRTFIDVYDPVDSYGKELWEELASHCRGDSGASLRLPGGRYACAVALKALSLPCLLGRCLGEIAHIVQIAISQRKILGYSNGAIVPYSHSQSMMKEECAKSRCPCSGTLDPTTVVSWEVARGGLWQILAASPTGQLPLPNVKRLFRSKLHLDLSETAFGYSKVSELLQDRRFQDICDVELRGHGYVVVLKRPTGNANVISLEQRLYAVPWMHPAIVNMVAVPTYVAEAPPQRVELCEPLCLPEGDDDDALPEKDVPVSLVQTPTATPGSSNPAGTWCLTPSTCLKLSQDGYRSIIHNTFIQVKHPPDSPQLPTSRSMPAGLSIGCGDKHHPTPLSHSDETTLDTSNTSGEESNSSLTSNNCLQREECDELNPLRELLNALPQGGPEPAGAGTPMDGIVCGARSSLRPLGKKRTANRVNFCLEDAVEDPAASPMSSSLLMQSQEFIMTPFTDFEEPQFQVERVVDLGVDEPLGLFEPEAQKPVNELPTLMTPGTFSEQGFVISNTFLGVKRQPPTPFRKRELRRSKSMDV